jgi:hypothetical protein
VLVELLDIVGSGVEGDEGAVWKESGGEVMALVGAAVGGAGRGGELQRASTREGVTRVFEVNLTCREAEAAAFSPDLERKHEKYIGTFCLHRWLDME